MPTAIVSSSNPFVPFSTVQRLYTRVIQNRMAASCPSRTKAVIICDALRDEYLSPYLQGRIRWVITNLVSMGVDRYDIVPCMVYWPSDGSLKKNQWHEVPTSEHRSDYGCICRCSHGRECARLVTIF